MECGEIVVIIKDLVIAGAALSTAVIAYLGLNKWKQELRGKVHFETARSLMLSIYKVRDEIKFTRNAVILPQEFPENYDYSDKSNQNVGNSYAYVYENRSKHLGEAMQKFEMYSLEAEALWGSDIKIHTKKLKVCSFQLVNSIKTFIDDKYNGGEIFKSDKKFADEIKRDVFFYGKETDPLSIEIQNIIEDIEKFIRPYLHK
jgi:hypothetical protein